MFILKNFKGTLEQLSKLIEDHNFNSVFSISEITFYPSVVQIEKSILQQVKDQLLELPTSSQTKIAAIKIHRNITNLGLKESKDWIEANLKFEYRSMLWKGE